VENSTLGGKIRKKEDYEKKVGKKALKSILNLKRRAAATLRREQEEERLRNIVAERCRKEEETKLRMARENARLEKLIKMNEERKRLEDAEFKLKEQEMEHEREAKARQRQKEAEDREREQKFLSGEDQLVLVGIGFKKVLEDLCSWRNDMKLKMELLKSRKVHEALVQKEHLMTDHIVKSKHKKNIKKFGGNLKSSMTEIMMTDDPKLT
jgi:hypothetical protein